MKYMCDHATEAQCPEIARLTAEVERRFDCHPADGVSRCNACVTCLTKEVERLRRERDEWKCNAEADTASMDAACDRERALREAVTHMTIEADAIHSRITRHEAVERSVKISNLGHAALATDTTTAEED